MTQGKNKRNFKKKGARKKVTHAFAKKNWYTILAPYVYQSKEATISPVTKTVPGKKEEDMLMGRIYEISLADLNRDAAEMNWRKIKLRVESVQGDHCYT